MAETKTSIITQPDTRWVPLVFGPFCFRRQPATLFGRAAAPGWTFENIIERAAKAHPYADPSDPNPISLRAEEGEGCLWVTWCFAIGGKGYVETDNYFADQLEAIDEIGRAILVKGVRRGGYPPEQLADATQAVARIKYFWQTLKFQFQTAVGTGAIKLMARISDPVAPFTEVAYDSFKHYRIKKWSLGTAEPATGNGPTLYSVHIDPMNEPLPDRKRLDDMIVGVGALQAPNSGNGAGSPDSPKDTGGPVARSYVRALRECYPNGIPREYQTQRVETDLWSFMEKNNLTRAKESSHSKQVNLARNNLGGPWAT